MTRIRFKVLLVALAGLLAGLATAELEFYQDVEPPKVDLERLVRLLESKSHASGLHHHQPLPQTRHYPQLEHGQPLALPLQQHEQQQLQQQQLHYKQQQRQHQQHLLDLARQKQRGLLRDDLPERPNIIDVLQREAADPLEYVRELERQRLLPYVEYETQHRVKPYSVEDEARARLMPTLLNKDPVLDYPETSHYVDFERARQLENARRIQEAFRRRPEFTYSFGRPEPIIEEGPPPFAVAPNDPRYYEDGPFTRDSTDESPSNNQPPALNNADDDNDSSQVSNNTPEPQHQQEHQHNHAEQQQQQQQQEQEQTFTKPLVRPNVEDVPDTSLVDAGFVLPEPQRRAEQDPLVVSLDRKVNNDIYFIAIVAGCSAAAMFALVLISLTWCRLQRVSKAAADVEYPAYGVTGPNKDISPSGDQRLAQSAQMYHFQHQKQQIIAMEKESLNFTSSRASTVRDPGSVSEAESDEENEEGDYTVYECPGLAPTGEMEVKNPMFHDDPTPATPAKSSRSRTDDDDDV